MGYSPWGLKESDTTEQLHYSLMIYLLDIDTNWNLWFKQQIYNIYLFPLSS